MSYIHTYDRRPLANQEQPRNDNIVNKPDAVGELEVVR